MKRAGRLAIIPVVGAEALLLLLVGLLARESALTSITAITLSAISSVAFIDCVRELRRQGPHRKPWRMPAVLASQAALIPFLFLPLWVESSSAVHNVSDDLILAVVIAALAVAISVLAAAVYARPTGAARTSWTVFLALLPLASAVQFWYTTIYRPAHDRPNVDVTMNLEQVDGAAGHTEMRATVVLSNDGPTVIDFFDALYTVTAFNGPNLQPTTATSVKLGPHQGVAWADTDAHYEGLLETGRLIRPGGHLTSGQKLLTSFAFDVTNAMQSKVRLTVFLSTIVDTGSGLGDSRGCKPAAGTALCEQTPIRVRGWVSSRLLDDPIARTYLHMSHTDVPYLTTEFRYGDSPGASADETYGILNSRRFTTSVECELKGR